MGTEATATNSRVRPKASLRCLPSYNHAVPAIYQRREFPLVGGLISYGSEIADSYRLAGPAGYLRAKSPPIFQSNKQTKSSCTVT